MRYFEILSENKSVSEYASQIWYHGSEHIFKEFGVSRRIGFWFTDNPKLTGYYGEHTYKVKLNLVNPFVISDEDYQYDWGKNKHNVLMHAKENGHDALIITDTIDGDTESTVCCVFDSKKIKIIDLEVNYEDGDDEYNAKVQKRLADISESVEPDEYYMEEGCGIFAYALSKISPGGKIVIISDNNGESWSRSIPFECTHVAYGTSFQDLYDVKGKRSVETMASEFNLSMKDFYSTKVFEPEEFKKKFLGLSDKFPLYGGEQDIADAVKKILSNKSKYGISDDISEAITDPKYNKSAIGSIKYFANQRVEIGLSTGKFSKLGEIKGYEVFGHEQEEGDLKYYIIDANKQAIGYIYLENILYDMYQIKMAFVDPEYQNKGFGKELYKFVLDRGHVVVGDTHVSVQAKKVWKSFLNDPAYVVTYYNGNEEKPVKNISQAFRNENYQLVLRKKSTNNKAE